MVMARDSLDVFTLLLSLFGRNDTDIRRPNDWRPCLNEERLRPGDLCARVVWLPPVGGLFVVVPKQVGLSTWSQSKYWLTGRAFRLVFSIRSMMSGKASGISDLQ